MSAYPTLKTIAKACDVSHVTVSRALRGEPGVRPETAQRIREYAEEVGYKANPVARSLVAGNSGPLTEGQPRAILIPYNKEWDHPDQQGVFWASVAGATEAAISSVHNIQLFGFNSRDDEFRRIRAVVEEGRVAGFLEFGLSEETMAYLDAKQVPVVSFVTNLEQFGSHRKARVYADHVQGYVEAWRYLLGYGHRRIGFVGLKDRSGGTVSHIREILAAAQFLTPVPALEPPVYIDDKASSEAIWETLVQAYGKKGSGRWPTAVFCTNDRMAHRFMIALLEHKMTIPHDLSIFGYGDFPSARLSYPAMTTIGKPRKEIAATMFRILENIIAGVPGSRSTVQVLPMRLVERESVHHLLAGRR
ncbi:MAG TPA: LacI family DNA-binding transcriptional regulator [Chthoniobacteraceae bacterium]|nr:LacI family DNA-binding transcriptional regulator [Chthoniobacteraceae bacterium]